MYGNFTFIMTGISDGFKLTQKRSKPHANVHFLVLYGDACGMTKRSVYIGSLRAIKSVQQFILTWRNPDFTFKQPGKMLRVLEA